MLCVVWGTLCQGSQMSAFSRETMLDPDLVSSGSGTCSLSCLCSVSPNLHENVIIKNDVAKYVLHPTIQILFDPLLTLGLNAV